MSDEEAEDWLGVAVGAVLHLPTPVLDKAALAARRTCTHHSQIVPAIIAEAGPILSQHKALSGPRLVTSSSPKRSPAPELTQADVDRLSPILKRIGVKAGYLVENEDGSFALAGETP